MDDTFILFNDPSHAPLFLQYLNNRHSNIFFSIEVETGGSLPFLDALISRDNNYFISSVYRNQLFTGLGTRFFSVFLNLDSKLIAFSPYYIELTV